MTARVSRRAFLAASAGGVAGLAAACQEAVSPDLRESSARLRSRPDLTTVHSVNGLLPLGLGDPNGKDGILYVPPSSHPQRGLPLIVALHGAGGTGRSWATSAWLAILDDLRVGMVAPDSRGIDTWDLPTKFSYGPDVPFIDDALAFAFGHVNVDPGRIAMVGFSDGATEALGLGLMNGDLFRGVVGFSPGDVFAPFARGNPRAFISHGTSDTNLPFFYTQNSIVPSIQSLGVTVKFRSFDGGHNIPVAIARDALKYALAL